MMVEYEQDRILLTTD